MRKIVTVILAVLMLASVFSFASCKTSADDITVKISFYVGDEEQFANGDKVLVNKEGATVIKALQEQIAQFNREIKIDTSKPVPMRGVGKYLSGTKTVKDEETGTSVDYTFGWIFTVNGQEPKEGTINDIAVNDGDEIKFIYTYSYVNENGVSVTENYKPEMNLFGELDD